MWFRAIRETSTLPRPQHYALKYGKSGSVCEFNFWLANRDGEQRYYEWFHAAPNPHWELDEFEWLIEPGDRIIEPGCHHGFLAMMLAHRVGEFGFVLSVDTLPENVMVCEAQIGANGLDGRCKAVHFAATDKPGKLRIGARTQQPN